MIKIQNGKLDFVAVEVELAEYKAFLDANNELKETGAGSLQEFFDTRLNLLLLMGDVLGPVMVPTHYQTEMSIFGEFRADYIVCEQNKGKFLFVEFEHALEDSIFSVKSDSKGATSYEWSLRFEHGFSQLVDWQFRIEDYRRTSKIDEHFGNSDILFQGVLVIGRDHFLKLHGTQKRFDWRVRNTVIASRPIHCITFDTLYSEMKGRLDNWKAVMAGNVP